MVSGYPTSISFPWVDGWSMDPRVLGSHIQYKDGLVAKGFHQQPSIEFHKTFSLVINPITICTVLGTALNCKWGLRYLDDK